MNMQKSTVFMMLILIILVVPILSSCEEDNMYSLEPTPDFSKLIEDGNLYDLTLTIYYKDFSVVTRAPVSLEQLKGGWYDNTGQSINGWYNHKVVVTGGDLTNHHDLLSQLSVAVLVPVDESFVNARLYYVFEHIEHGEIFSVLAFGGSDTIFVNGLEVEYNSIFFEVVLPFLPGDAVETIETYLDTMLGGQ